MGRTTQINDLILLNSPVVLPNGITVRNRLVKAAMEEGIGYGGVPTEDHVTLYERWGQGEWGVIISGNVQVDARHLATPHDLTVSSALAIPAYTSVALAIHSSFSDTLAIMQISHPGLQSSPVMGLSRPPWCPAVSSTAARPDLGDTWLGWLLGRFLWPRPSRQVEDATEWLEIVERFVYAARIAETSGWNGIQVHSAHGYLLAEYLSPLTNPRPQPLPGVPSRIPLRLHLLYLILTGIHACTERKFVKAVKINCSDFVQGGLDEEQAAEMIKAIVSWKLVDMLEVSGGTYGNPAFARPDAMSNSRATRQSLFEHFTRSLLPFLPPPPVGPAIILTGGLHSRHIAASALRSRACDLVGLGRPACLIPELPRNILLNRDVPEDQTHVGGYEIRGGETMKHLLGGGYSSTMPKGSDSKPKSSSGIPLIGAGVSTLWHEWQLCRLGRGVEPDRGMHWFWGGLVKEGIWMTPRICLPNQRLYEFDHESVLQLCQLIQQIDPALPSSTAMKRETSASPTPTTPPPSIKKPRPSPAKTPSKPKPTKTVNGEWTPTKRGAFLDQIIAVGYKHADLDELANQVSTARQWAGAHGMTISVQLGMSKRQLVDQLVPNRAGNIRGKAVKNEKGE
ncbi:hypothetical protein P7C73_g2627, partial [Tremellales sp. Uapishka_1]